MRVSGRLDNSIGEYGWFGPGGRGEGVLSGCCYFYLALNLY